MPLARPYFGQTGGRPPNAQGIRPSGLVLPAGILRRCRRSLATTMGPTGISGTAGVRHSRAGLCPLLYVLDPRLRKGRGRRGRGVLAVTEEITSHLASRVANGQQWWSGRGTDLHGMRAAGTEAASGGRIDRVRWVAGEGRTLDAFIGVHRRGRGEERLRIGCGGMAETSSAPPIPTTCPGYMTSTRPLSYSMTCKSREMKT